MYPTPESLSLAYMELHESKGGGEAGDAACAEMLVSIPYSAKPPKGGLKTLEQMEKKTTRAKQTHVYPAQSAAVYSNYKVQRGRAVPLVTPSLSTRTFGLNLNVCYRGATREQPAARNARLKARYTPRIALEGGI